LQIQVDLRCNLASRAIGFEVWKVCTSIRTRHLNPLQIGHVLREYLYPRIELNLIFGKVTQKALQRWDSQVRSASLHWGHDAATRNVCSQGLYSAAGILPLSLHCALVRANDAGVVLRSAPAPCAATTNDRVASAIAARKLRAEDFHHGLSRICPVRSRSRVCRITGALYHAASLNHHLTRRREQDPHRRAGCVPVIRPDDAGYTVFTDGSYKASGGGRCGFAAVICRTADLQAPGYNFQAGTYVVRKGSAPLAGANFAAEVMALLETLRVVPVNTPLVCVSDAFSALQVLRKPCIANGARVRLGARSLVVPARALLRLRAATTRTDFVHVRSHSGGDSLHERGNAVADREARKAADACTPCGPALEAEEAFVFWRYHARDRVDPGSESNFYHVHGDLRKSLKKCTTSNFTKTWADLPSQGAILRTTSPAGALHLLKLARSTRDPRLLTFCLKAVTLQLSTSDKMRFRTSSAVLEARKQTSGGVATAVDNTPGRRKPHTFDLPSTNRTPRTPPPHLHVPPPFPLPPARFAGPHKTSCTPSSAR
jgi:hypothetical protein